MLDAVIILKEYKQTTWYIVPENTPAIIKHCSKCNQKSNYYCSEKFRINANQSRVDIWLIYKCKKCDSTWKLAINKGIRPRDVPAGLFEQFIDNDKDLAWQYAFDRQFLRQHSCVVDYAGVGYVVQGVEAWDGPLHVRVVSPFIFDLKLSALLAKALGVSVGQIKKLAESGMISASLDAWASSQAASPSSSQRERPGSQRERPALDAGTLEIDIMKHRIKSDFDVFLHL